MEGHWKFLGGEGVLKAKFLEAMYENKLEYPGGRGVQNKNPEMGGVWIFSGTAHYGSMIQTSKSFQFSLCTRPRFRLCKVEANNHSQTGLTGSGS